MEIFRGLFNDLVGSMTGLPGRARSQSAGSRPILTLSTVRSARSELDRVSRRRLVFAVIDQRIVQAAETSSRIERDVGKAVTFDQIDNDVGLPATIGFADSFRAYCRHPGSPMLGGDRVPIIVAVVERSETTPDAIGGGR